MSHFSLESSSEAETYSDWAAASEAKEEILLCLRLLVVCTNKENTDVEYLREKICKILLNPLINNGIMGEEKKLSSCVDYFYHLNLKALRIYGSRQISTTLH